MARRQDKNIQSFCKTSNFYFILNTTLYHEVWRWFQIRNHYCTVPWMFSNCTLQSFVIYYNHARKCTTVSSQWGALLQFHENVLARTILHAGNFLWMAKRVINVTSVSTTLWTSRWSKCKVHWVIVNWNFYNGVKVNVNDIAKHWHFPLTSSLKRGYVYVHLVNHKLGLNLRQSRLKT